jgi:flagellar basal-body rod modification protein FlgD
MATVNPTSSAQTPTTAASAAGNKLAGDFDQFLKLLTTQLQYQDPTSPMDTTEFTNQLVQFASVEQQIAQSKSLESLINIQESWQTANAINYIGKEVDIAGKNITLVEGQGVLGYTLAANSESTTITIKDSSGKAIRTVSGDKTTGTHAYIWDGRTDAGVKMSDGTYTFEVTAKDAGGKAITVSTQFTGTVTGVTNHEGTIVLEVGVLKVPLSDVSAVRTPKPAADDDDTDTTTNSNTNNNTTS